MDVRRSAAVAFDKDFFDLQFSFAEIARELSGASLEAALLEYTNFYVRFGFGRSFDANHEGWQRYLAGLRTAADGRAWTYRVYLTELEAGAAPLVAATFGCFSYELRDGNVVRLHFHNSDSPDSSPLGTARMHRRRAELTDLFAHMRAGASRDIQVVGASWLYNLRVYRRLFPPAYVSSARPIRGAFRSMPLWGQFLDRRGTVRSPISEPFLRAIAHASSLGDLGECFPLQALAVAAPAHEFYRFYGL